MNTFKIGQRVRFIRKEDKLLYNKEATIYDVKHSEYLIDGIWQPAVTIYCLDFDGIGKTFLARGLFQDVVIWLCSPAEYLRPLTDPGVLSMLDALEKGSPLKEPAYVEPKADIEELSEAALERLIDGGYRLCI